MNRSGPTAPLFPPAHWTSHWANARNGANSSSEGHVVWATGYEKTSPEYLEPNTIVTASVLCGCYASGIKTGEREWHHNSQKAQRRNGFQKVCSLDAGKSQCWLSNGEGTGPGADQSARLPISANQGPSSACWPGTIQQPRRLAPCRLLLGA